MNSPSATDSIVLAADGGGTKTDLVLVGIDGSLLGHARGGSSQVHYLGASGTIEVLEELLNEATRSAGLDPRAQPVAATGHFLLAGIDVPGERTALEESMNALHWTRELVIGNDTDALLRAGSDRGWGIAIVCGTGINCLGLAPNGREARFLSFGDISGDWGGGPDLGVAALAAAVRATDARGPVTSLATRLPEYFGAADPLDLAQAFHLGLIPRARVAEICPLVFAMRHQDDVAAAIVGRLVEQVVDFARAAMRRLDLLDSDADVVFGGGVLSNVDADVIDAIAAAIRRFAPSARVFVSPSDPIVGAAFLGLDALGAGDGARTRARAALDALNTRS